MAVSKQEVERGGRSMGDLWEICGMDAEPGWTVELPRSASHLWLLNLICTANGWPSSATHRRGGGVTVTVLSREGVLGQEGKVLPAIWPRASGEIFIR